jgi:hypothetical protein
MLGYCIRANTLIKPEHQLNGTCGSRPLAYHFINGTKFDTLCLSLEVFRHYGLIVPQRSTGVETEIISVVYFK